MVKLALVSAKEIGSTES